MKDLLNFFINIGTLKRKRRKGWLVHEIKDPETTAEHSFRMVMLAWILGTQKRKLNLSRVIKMALIHDLCEVYAPDLTPYDPLLPKDIKKAQEILKKWPKFTLAQKKRNSLKKARMETKALEKLIKTLSPVMKKEIEDLWEDFNKGLSPEGRFVKQIDKVESILQGSEYWRREGKIQHHLWMRWAKEIIDDPVLVDFVKTIEKEFHKPKRKKK